ncbi:MAG: AAA family ATPase [Chlorobiales bacterium]|nr:AAA family ATPase [Chlorobiales bacterium]
MEPLAVALSHPEAYPHSTGTIEVVETHISWIFLTESYAYKVKKPLNLGFLDFSTLEKRQYYCHEELRLNRRLCPEIYLSIVPVVKSANSFCFESDGEIIDYAVKMVRFDRTMELDRLLSSGKLSIMHIDILAHLIAEFHQHITSAGIEKGFGHPDNLIKPILDNFAHTKPVVSNRDEANRLELLKKWTIKEHQRLYPLFLERQIGGFIRQCHGDMHTGNMVWWKNRIFIFDCIEFNENLSIIDVISDLAFLYMDLEHAEYPEFSWRLLNNYLKETGDYGALPLLRFYAVYRAMVRAKVTAIRYVQTSEKVIGEKILEEHFSYLRLAEHYTRKQKPLLMLTCGVSGSGKTTLSSDIAQAIQSVHIRSDIERKRLAGLNALDRSDKTQKAFLYSDEMGRQTYERLLHVATLCIDEGLAVIVDATFLKAAKRKLFIELARKLHCPCRILHFHAPRKVLFERVLRRFQIGNDASEADITVLESQLEQQEALTEEENSISIRINTSEPADLSAITTLLQSVMT